MSIAGRLPKDTKIVTTGTSPVQVWITMTITSVDEALALKSAIDLAIIPMIGLTDLPENYDPPIGA